MKVLLTGATGFLGQQVYQALLKDDRVSEITVLSRKKLHIHQTKTTSITIDLRSQEAVATLPRHFDAVIHLAGLYDLSEGPTANYEHNVLATQNLVRALNQFQLPPRLIFASSYVVTCGTDESRELPLTQLPSAQSYPYAFSKAVAERIVTDSQLATICLRFGILVGSTSDGSTPKFDGPYSTLKLVRKLSQTVFGKQLPFLPIPANPDSKLPLVAVDQAADVVLKALFVPLQKHENKIFGVYREDSLAAGEFIDRMIARYLPKTKPYYFTELSQSLIPKIPVALLAKKFRGTFESYRYLTENTPMSSTYFEAEFGKNAISHFDVYSETFFSGFEKSEELRK